MMVEIVRGTVAAGRAVEPGDEIELEDAEAKYLIALGKARLIEKIVADPESVKETAERTAPEKRKK